MTSSELTELHAAYRLDDEDRIAAETARDHRMAEAIAVILARLLGGR